MSTTAIRYVTNQLGETTDVLVPIEIWQKLLTRWQDAKEVLAQKHATEQADDDEVLAVEWLAEIDRRCLQIDTNKVALIPVEEGLAQLRQRFTA